jgi:hypothetical protein
MNIFILSKSPLKSAKYHTDKHVVKMILESAQMLSTAHRLIEKESISKEKSEVIYQEAYKNHPCTIWTRTSKDNYMWLFRLFDALLDEYTIRFGKIHSSSKLKPYLSSPPNNIPDMGLTRFAQAMPEQYKKENPVEAYRLYYFAEKSHLFVWSKTDVPEWLEPTSPTFLKGE